jgi:hypothetical protein
MLGGEALSAFGYEIDMRALAQNLARRAHGIAQPLHASHASGAQRGTVHDERIELYLAIAVQETSATRVEGLVVFHDDDGLFDGIECRAAALQHLPSGGQSVAHAAQVGVDHVIGYGPCTAVNNQNRISRQGVSPEEVR